MCQPNCSGPQPNCPKSAESAVRSTSRTTNRGFHSSIFFLQNAGRQTGRVSGFAPAEEITRRGDRAIRNVYPSKGTLGKAGLRERPAPPREFAAVPAGQRRNGDAIAGRMDEPAVAEIDAHVADLRRPRARPPVA